MTVERVPSVLFVCVKNGGKSQMAAALMRQLGGIAVYSAGTHPSSKINAESAEAVAEVGASMEGQLPQLIDPQVFASADRVVVIGTEAQVEPVEGMRGSIEVWDTDEPSLRGIGGMERMRLVRDDIAERVQALREELAGQPENDPAEAGRAVRIFEPAMCCNTGVCGPEEEDLMVRFTADVNHLKSLGVDVIRHNLASEPTVFASTPVVSDFLRVAGSAGLPLILVDNVTVSTGRYPDRQELLRLAGHPTAVTTDLGLTAADPEGAACCRTEEGSSCC